VGLADAPRMVQRFAGELSGGQRQRVCLAVAMACQVGLMVADEPTSALDVVTQQRVLAVLERYPASGGRPALLFITHDLAAAALVCQRAVTMRAGAIIADGPVPAVSDALTVRAAPAVGGETSERRPSAPDGSFRLSGVSRVYPAPRSSGAGSSAITALAPTTLRITAGERVGIVGISGAGKTTLLRLMLALETPSAGEISYDGRRIRAASARALRWYRRRVQYVPQDPAGTLHPRMSVARLVREPLLRLRVPGPHEGRVADALRAVGLDAALRHRRVHELSGGQAQRVALARAIATEPDVLLADEPVSGLDRALREQIVEVLDQVCTERGMSLVVVSHDLSVVADLCERTLVMYAGDVVEDRPTADLLALPRHHHTRELLDAIGALTGRKGAA
ncbi:MAG: ABC transporter ATP-binding protein, partial [Propioniciclava sp.]